MARRRLGRWARLGWGAIAVALAAADPSPAQASPAVHLLGAKVAATFGRPGPYRVKQATFREAVGNRVVTFEVFRPASYRALRFESPIVAFGDGTDAAPPSTYYSALFDQWASWGLTVVAPDLADTGRGREILAGAEELVRLDHTPTSPYAGHLDSGEVAAVGHSQGATGAVRAAVADPGLVKAVMTFSLPWNGQGPRGSHFASPASSPHGWAAANADCPRWTDCWADPGALTRPTFLISTRGPLDAAIAPPGVERCYFEELRAPSAQGVVLHAPAGSSRLADHNTVQNAAAGGLPSVYFGYSTAWLLYRLRSDQRAAPAFTGPHPELVSDPNWFGSTVSGVRAPRLACDDAVSGAPSQGT